VEPSDKEVTYLFVQQARAGTFVPVPGEEGRFALTLTGVTPQTIYFSDRPQRIVGQAAMQPFLDALCHDDANPPNAALVILEGDEQEDVVVVELLDPAYDPAAATLRYTAKIMEEPGHSLAVYNERHDGRVPESFGAASLFIDDCEDVVAACSRDDRSFCGNVTCCQCYGGTLPFLHCGFQADCCSINRCDGKCRATYGQDCRFRGLDKPIR
jgi:hypothetical protein